MVQVDRELQAEVVSTNGKEIQSTICMEECAELIQAISKMKRGKDNRDNLIEEMADVLKSFGGEETARNTQFGSCIYAKKPGDGSAREQAASCQKVLGGLGNICVEFATKRYRSNCINWGILPFTTDKDEKFIFETGDYVFIPGVRQMIESGKESIMASVIRNGDEAATVKLSITGLTEDEKRIILDGCLINYYAERMKTCDKDKNAK